jgi:hypothetical protein
MKKLFTLTVLLAVVFCAANVFAALTATVPVTATIPSENALSVTVSKVVGSTWTDAISVAFGDLEWDSTNSMFVPQNGTYYVVDVDIDSNASTWTVTHTTSSLSSGLEDLDDHVIVSFYNQTASSTGTLLAKYSFGNSNNKAYTNSQLTNSWLRIYYGIATTSDSSIGVTPIGSDVGSGDYTGSVTLTLSTT